MKTISILGANSQIAKGLIAALSDTYRLALYARRPNVVEDFLGAQGIGGPHLSVHPLTDPLTDDTDLIVNAIGPGDPRTIRGAPDAIETITEQYDLMVLDLLRNRPETGYVFLSTGAVYGKQYDDAERPDILMKSRSEDLAPWDRYPRAKLMAEARHRTAAELRIADLRIFGYASRYIDPDRGFFLSEVARALLDGTPFLTGPEDFARDYIGPDDLAGLIRHLMQTGVPNGVYDTVSTSPTTKHELLNHLAAEFGLEVRVTDDSSELENQPVVQSMVFPHPAARIGYKPLLTSLETVSREFGALAAGAGARTGRPPRQVEDENLRRCQS